MSDRADFGVATVVFTDGRDDCLAETLASYADNVHLPDVGHHWRIIVDDSADPEHAAHLAATHGINSDRRDGWSVLSSAVRRGFGGTIRSTWRLLDSYGYGNARMPYPRFVFHLEDDFTFNRPVDVSAMARVLDAYPHLAQIALVRQAWNDAETAAGGVIARQPDAYVQHSAVLDGTDDVAWLEHALFFTTNPSLYRRSLCARGWPVGEHSEGRFALDLFASDDKLRSAYWGHADDGPWVTHIGRARVGTGY